MAKRMKLISEEEYNTLIKFRNKDILKSSEINLVLDKNESMKDVLNSDIPDDIKVNLYSKLLKDVHAQAKKIEDRPILIKNSNSNTEDLEAKKQVVISDQLTGDDLNIIEPLPPTFKMAAMKILKELKAHPKLIHWDSHGILTILESVVPGSNLFDLLSYVLRPGKKFPTSPVGLNRFFKVLKVLNIPASLLGSHVRKIFATTEEGPLSQTRNRQSLGRTNRGRKSITVRKNPITPSHSIVGWESNDPDDADFESADELTFD